MMRLPIKVAVNYMIWRAAKLIALGASPLALRIRMILMKQARNNGIFMRIARISALRLQRFLMPGMIRDARRAYFVNISYLGDKFGEILEVLEITHQEAHIVFM